MPESAPQLFFPVFRLEQVLPIVRGFRLHKLEENGLLMITKCPVQIFPAIFPHRHKFTHRNLKRLSVPQSGLYKVGRNRLHCSLIIILHISHIMTCYERKWTREKASKDREHETTSESLSHTDECNAIPLRVFERVWFGRYDTISAKVKSKAKF